MIEDFCDGTMVANHPLFSQDPYALQIIAYYDEVEICNPLGSHIKRHKLGIVFYTLGNIAPLYHSQLKIINLAIVATAPVIEKHGIDAILRPFIADLNILATTGVSLSVMYNVLLKVLYWHFWLTTLLVMSLVGLKSLSHLHFAVVAHVWSQMTHSQVQL